MADESVDIIIPVFNKAAITKGCLDSITANSDTPYRIILIDNASGGETKRYLEAFAGAAGNVTLVRNGSNLGWVKSVNRGIGMSSSPYICIMNNDTVVRTPGWLAKLTAVARDSDDIGLVNPCFDSISGAAIEKPYIEIDFCRGYCILVKRAVIEKVGALDEAYGMGYYDDDDLSVRAIHAGFRCVRANDVVVEHLKDSTFSDVFRDDARRRLHEENKRLFYSKWGRRLKIVFITTKASGRDSLKDALLLLARRQHIIYLWNLSGPLGIKHTSIRERSFSRTFSTAIFAMALLFNAMKREAKQYDLVFVDDPGLAARLSKDRPAVYYANAVSDAGKIVQIADSAAKDTK
ncbi:MAG: glycosyltransferase family 2 protein [Candidatus Omnitrophota bacterium]